MANETFSAGEIKRQAGRLREQTDNFVQNARKITEYLDEIRAIMGDNAVRLVGNAGFSSNLSGEINELKFSYERLTQATFKAKFNDLADKMDNWANKTIENEEETSSSVNSTLSDLEFINHILSLVK